MPPAYEVLLLNTAVPQIQAAQSGDTYVVPRDIAFSTVANLANGTNLLPSLTFSSDTNTGIYREGADALGFTAGGGSDQMVLTSTGLGIGTNSIIYGASGRGVVNLGGSGGGLLGFQVGGVAKGYVAHFDSSMQMWNEAASPILFATNALERMRLDASGNLGLGVTPSAWGSAYKAVQLFFGFGPFASNAGATGLSGNCFNNGTNWVYSSSNPATRYELGPDGGNHRWYTAPSGTANSTTIVSGNEYTIVTAGGNFTAFGAANNNVGTVFTATSSGTATGGAATQSIVFSQAMTLSSDGTFRVKGAGTAGTTDAFQISGSAPADAARLTSGGDLLVGTTSGSAKIVAVSAVAADSASFSDGSNYTLAVRRLPSATGGMITGTAGSSLGFGTDATERARITSGGDFCFNTTATTIATITQNALVARITNGSLLVHHENGNSGSDFAGFGYNGSTIGTISQSSTTTVAYNTSSDYRLKNNPQPLTGSGAFIDALQPKIWNWKTDGSKGVGFIAHEVQAVSPGSVTGVKDAVDEDGKPIIQMMEYGSAEFIANIVAELQSLRARVAQLEQGA
jgi:hypothetical protein